MAKYYNYMNCKFDRKFIIYMFDDWFVIIFYLFLITLNISVNIFGTKRGIKAIHVFSECLYVTQGIMEP